MLDSMYKTMSISSGLYPNLDLWNANKLQLQLQFTSRPVSLQWTVEAYGVCALTP